MALFSRGTQDNSWASTKNDEERLTFSNAYKSAFDKSGDKTLANAAGQEALAAFRDSQPAAQPFKMESPYRSAFDVQRIFGISNRRDVTPVTGRTTPRYTDNGLTGGDWFHSLDNEGMAEYSSIYRGLTDSGIDHKRAMDMTQRQMIEQDAATTSATRYQKLMQDAADDIEATLGHKHFNELGLPEQRAMLDAWDAGRTQQQRPDGTSVWVGGIDAIWDWYNGQQGRNWGLTEADRPAEGTAGEGTEANTRKTALESLWDLHKQLHPVTEEDEEYQGLKDELDAMVTKYGRPATSFDEWPEEAKARYLEINARIEEIDAADIAESEAKAKSRLPVLGTYDLIRYNQLKSELFGAEERALADAKSARDQEQDKYDRLDQQALELERVGVDASGLRARMEEQRTAVEEAERKVTEAEEALEAAKTKALENERYANLVARDEATRARAEAAAGVAKSWGQSFWNYLNKGHTSMIDNMAGLDMAISDAMKDSTFSVFHYPTEAEVEAERKEWTEKYINEYGYTPEKAAETAEKTVRMMHMAAEDGSILTQEKARERRVGFQEEQKAAEEAGKQSRAEAVKNAIDYAHNMFKDEQYVNEENVAAVINYIDQYFVSATGEQIGRQWPSLVMSAMYGLGGGAASEGGKIFARALKNPGFFFVFMNEYSGEITEKYDSGEELTSADWICETAGAFLNSIIEYSEGGIEDVLSGAGGSFLGSIITENWEELRQGGVSRVFDNIADYASDRQPRHPIYSGEISDDAIICVADIFNTILETTLTTAGMNIAHMGTTGVIQTAVEKVARGEKLSTDEARELGQVMDIVMQVAEANRQRAVFEQEANGQQDTATAADNGDVDLLLGNDVLVPDEDGYVGRHLPDKTGYIGRRLNGYFSEDPADFLGKHAPMGMRADTEGYLGRTNGQYSKEGESDYQGKHEPQPTADEDGYIGKHSPDEEGYTGRHTSGYYSEDEDGSDGRHAPRALQPDEDGYIGRHIPDTEGYIGRHSSGYLSEEDEEAGQYGARTADQVRAIIEQGENAQGEEEYEGRHAAQGELVEEDEEGYTPKHQAEGEHLSGQMAEDEEGYTPRHGAAQSDIAKEMQLSEMPIETIQREVRNRRRGMSLDPKLESYPMAMLQGELRRRMAGMNDEDVDYSADKNQTALAMMSDEELALELYDRSGGRGNVKYEGLTTEELRKEQNQRRKADQLNRQEERAKARQDRLDGMSDEDLAGELFRRQAGQGSERYEGLSTEELRNEQNQRRKADQLNRQADREERAARAARVQELVERNAQLEEQQAEAVAEQDQQREEEKAEDAAEHAVEEGKQEKTNDENGAEAVAEQDNKTEQDENVDAAEQPVYTDEKQDTRADERTAEEVAELEGKTEQDEKVDTVEQTVLKDEKQDMRTDERVMEAVEDQEEEEKEELDTPNEQKTDVVKKESLERDDRKTEERPEPEPRPAPDGKRTVERGEVKGDAVDLDELRARARRKILNDMGITPTNGITILTPDQAKELSRRVQEAVKRYSTQELEKAEREDQSPKAEAVGELAADTEQEKEALTDVTESRNEMDRSAEKLVDQEEGEKVPLAPEGEEKTTARVANEELTRDDKQTWEKQDEEPEPKPDGERTVERGTVEFKEDRIDAEQEETKQVAERLGIKFGEAKATDRGAYISRGGKTITAEQAAVIKNIDKIAQEHGFAVQFQDTINEGKANGAYDNGVIRIALDAEDAFGDVMGHELVHMLNKVNPGAAQKLETLFRKYTDARGLNVDRMIESKIAQYGRYGIELNRAQAMEEVIASNMYDTLQHVDTMRTAYVQDQGLYRRIIKWVQGVRESIRSMLKGQDMDQVRKRVLELENERLDRMTQTLLQGIDEGNKLNQIKKDGAKNTLTDQKLKAHQDRLREAESVGDAHRAVRGMAEEILRRTGNEVTDENVMRVLGASMYFVARKTGAGQELRDSGLKYAMGNDPELNRALDDIGRYIDSVVREFGAQGYMDLMNGKIGEETDREKADRERRFRDLVSEQRDSSHPSSEQFSVKQLTDGLSLRTVTDADGNVRVQKLLQGKNYVIVDKAGNAIKGITKTMVKGTPMGMLIDVAEQRGKLTAKQADAQRQMLADLANLCIRYENQAMVWEIAGNLMFSAIKNNSDAQYGTTVDFGTVCSKTQAIVDVLSETMVRTGRGLDREMVMHVYKNVAKTGLAVPCPVCYVFSRWMGVPGLLGSMARYQDRFGKMTAKEVADWAQKVERENPPNEKDTAAQAISKKVQQYKNQLKTVEKQGKAAMERGDQQEVDRLIKEADRIDRELEEVEAYNWVTQVMCKTNRKKQTVRENGRVVLDPNYQPVDKAVLLDMRRTGEFADNPKWAKSWTYRCTRGAGMGKAILPYSGFGVGDAVYYAAKGGQKIRQPLSNAFLKMDKAAAAKAVKAAADRMQSQNLLGGHRFQSTSDYRPEWGLDYMMSFLELQAIGAKGQLYTKVIEAVDLFASAGIEVNLSIMPRGDGYTVVDGKPMLDAKSSFSTITGINFEQALEKTRDYDNVQMILVGINDIQIELAMADERIGFIIPWHSSGSNRTTLAALMDGVNEKLLNARNYESIQTDKVRSDRTKEQEEAARVRKNILTQAYKKGISQADLAIVNGNKFLKDLYRRFYLDKNAEEYGVKLSAKQAGQIFPFEYWNTQLRIDQADENGRRFVEYCKSLGLTPRFEEFSEKKGYWKLLIDRRMYNRDGSYHKQQTIDGTNVKIKDIPSAVNVRSDGKQDKLYGDPKKTADAVAATLDDIRARESAPRFTDFVETEEEEGTEEEAQQGETMYSLKRSATDDELDRLELNDVDAGQRQESWALLDQMTEMKRQQRKGQYGEWKSRISDMAQKLIEETGSQRYTKQQLERQLTELFENLDNREKSEKLTPEGYLRSALDEIRYLATNMLSDTAYDEGMEQVKQVLKGGFVVTDDQFKEMGNAAERRDFRRAMSGIARVYTEKTKGVQRLSDIWMEQLNPIDPGAFSEEVNELDYARHLMEYVKHHRDQSMYLDQRSREFVQQLALSTMAEYFAQDQDDSEKTRRTRDALKKANSKVNSLSDQLQKQINQRLTLEKELESAKSERDRLSSQLADQQADSIDGQSKLNEAKRQVADAQQKIRDLVKEQQETTRQLNENHEESEKLQKQLDRQDRKNARLRQQLEEMRKGISKMRNEFRAEDRIKREARAKETADRKDVKRTSDRLRRRMENPSPKAFIPMDCVKPALDLVEASQSNDKRAIAQATQAFQDVVHMYRMSDNYQKSHTFSEEFEQRLNEAARLLNENSVNNLHGEELRFVADVFREMEHQIDTSVKMIGYEKHEDALREGFDMVQNLQAQKERPATGLKALAKKFAMDHLSPERFFRYISGYKDSAFTRISDQLNQGQRKEGRARQQLVTTYEALTTGENEENFKRFTGKGARQNLIDTGIKRADGTTFKITQAMRVSLYLHSQNEQNLKHFKYGITMPNLDLLLRGKTQEAFDKSERMMVTNDDLKRILSGMTEYEKAWAAAYRQMTKLTQKFINETSLQLNGYEKAGVQNYFPIKTDKNFLANDFESLVRDGTLEGMGMLKKRVNGTNPMLLEDVVSVVNRQIDGTSRYYGFAIPVRNFMLMYNSNIGEYDTSLKTELRRVWGSDAIRYIENLMNDVQGNKKGMETTFLDAFRGAYASSVLTLNPTVMIKQTASVPTAAAVIGWKAINKALTHPRKVDVDIINKYTSAYWQRTSGSLTDREANAQRGKALRTANKLSQGIQAADLGAVRRIWDGCAYKVEEVRPDLERGTDEYWRETAKWYEATLENTQPEYTTMQRPQILRSENQLLRSMTMFKTQSMQNFNILFDASADYMAKSKQLKADPDNKVAQSEYKVSKSKLALAISSQIVSAGVLAVMTAVGKLLLHKPEPYQDEAGEITTGSVVSRLGRDAGSSVAGMVVGGGELYDLIMAIIDGKSPFDIEAGNVSVLNDLYQGAYKLGNAAKSIADSSLTPEQKLEKIRKPVIDFANSAAAALGIPAKNIENILMSAYTYGKDIARGEVWEGLQGTVSTTAGAEKLGRALLDGDKATYERYYNRMRLQGKSNSQISSAVKGWLRKNDPRVIQAAQAIENGDLTTYNRLINEMTSDGIPMAMAVSMIELERKTLNAEETTTAAVAQDEPYVRQSYDEIIQGQQGRDAAEYTTGQMNALLEAGNTRGALQVQKELFKTKGTTSVKSALTSYWKPKYQAAYQARNRAEVTRIEKLMKTMGLTDKTLAKWKTVETNTAVTQAEKKTGFGSSSGSGLFGSSSSSKKRKSSKKKSSVFGSGSGFGTGSGFGSGGLFRGGGFGG